MCCQPSANSQNQPLKTPHFAPFTKVRKIAQIISNWLSAHCKQYFAFLRFCVFVFRILTAKCDATKKRTVLGERLKGGSKNSGFMFYLFWRSPFRPLFVFWLPPKVLPLGKSQTSLVFAHLIVPFGVILSSLISHIARCASRRLDAARNKSQTSLTILLSPFTIFVSLFNLQKHIRK